MRLEGKSIVVTGASAGMGKAIANTFVREGANVIAVARRQERLEELAASLADAPGKLIPYVGDVSLQEVNEKMIDFAVQQFGRLDVLVNNAGIMDDMSPIGEFPDEKLAPVFAINTFGPMWAMRKAVQVFLSQGTGGNIITVSSVGAWRSSAGPIYCASKAAVTAAAKNTAYMYMKEGIRSNVIAPGSINSEIGAAMGMPNMTGYQKTQPLRDAGPEIGTTQQIADAALFLASDESSYVNGIVMPVDGGWCAG